MNSTTLHSPVSGFSAVAKLGLAYVALLSLALLAQNPFLPAGSYAGAVKAFYQEFLEPVAHLLAFAPLGYFCARGRWPWSRWVTATGCVAYGFATELAQFAVPGRTPDWIDACQDMAGLAVGASLAWLQARSTPRGEREV